MSIDESNQESVRVINEEYERVLSNPDNLIMSDALQELMDMPMAEAEHSYKDEIDTLILTLIDYDGLGVSVRGRLSELSYIGDSEYRISVESSNIRREFLSVLEGYTRLEEPDFDSPLIIGGQYDAELSKAVVLTWEMQQSDPHMFKLSLVFRSEDVIF